jgi:molecular chaperone DnaK (HSP70)
MAPLGIDFGLSNSRVATFADRHEPVLLAIGEGGSRAVPSIVYAGKDGMLVGARAKARWPDVFCFVRPLMGRRYDDAVVRQLAERVPYEVVPVTPADGGEPIAVVRLGDVTMTPVEVSAAILRKLRRDVGCKLRDHVTHAVVTVPTYFDDAHRAATLEAARLAGLAVLQILDEPLAVALAYGVALDRGVRHVLVYDFGAKAVDVSLLLVADGIPMVETTGGVMWCGGDDFDYLIMDHVLEQVDAGHHGATAALRANTRFRGQLKEKAELAKLELGQAASVDIYIPNARVEGDTIDIEVAVQRSDFERWIQPTIDDTIELVHKTLRKSDVSPGEIDHVLLAGGSTRIPLVRRMLAAVFEPERVYSSDTPGECIALGAAIRARDLAWRIGVPLQAKVDRECGPGREGA